MDRLDKKLRILLDEVDLRGQRAHVGPVRWLAAGLQQACEGRKRLNPGRIAAWELPVVRNSMGIAATYGQLRMLYGCRKRFEEANVGRRADADKSISSGRVGDLENGLHREDFARVSIVLPEANLFDAVVGVERHEQYAG